MHRTKVFKILTAWEIVYKQNNMPYIHTAALTPLQWAVENACVLRAGHTDPSGQWRNVARIFQEDTLVSPSFK